MTDHSWPEASPELLARVQAQTDESAFIELYRLYAQRVLRFALVKVRNQELAEDIAQETFVSILKYVHTYQDQGRPFSAWVFTVAMNHIRAHYRKQRVEFVEDEVLTQMPDERQLAGMHQQREMIDVQRALVQCSPADQLILHLKYIEDRANEEIAEMLGISANTCTVRIHRALKRLRKHL